MIHSIGNSRPSALNLKKPLTINRHEVNSKALQARVVLLQPQKGNKSQLMAYIDRFSFSTLGYHQKCHNPAIADKALEPEEPWMCTYCTNGFECPYLLNPFETKLREEFYSARKSSEDTKVRRIAARR